MRKQPIEVDDLVLVQDAFLSVSQLVVWNQIEVALERARVVVDIPRPVSVISIEVVTDFSFEQFQGTKLLTLVFQMIKSSKL